MPAQNVQFHFPEVPFTVTVRYQKRLLMCHASCWSTRWMDSGGPMEASNFISGSTLLRSWFMEPKINSFSFRKRKKCSRWATARFLKIISPATALPQHLSHRSLQNIQHEFSCISDNTRFADGGDRERESHGDDGEAWKSERNNSRLHPADHTDRRVNSTDKHKIQRSSEKEAVVEKGFLQIEVQVLCWTCGKKRGQQWNVEEWNTWTLQQTWSGSKRKLHVTQICEKPSAWSGYG